MRKYFSLLKYEMKTILKDPMNIFILFFPFLMLFIAGFLLPGILERANATSNTSMIALLIGFVTALAVGGYISAVLLGFSLLENRDEKTLINIAVSPVTVSGYTLFKMIYSYIIGVLGNIILFGGLILFAKEKYVIVVQEVEIGLLDNFTVWDVIFFSIVTALSVPALAVFMPMIAKNKIEGFAFMKMGGLVCMIPALALLTAFQDWKQYLLGIVPFFWPIKAILNVTMQIDDPSNLPFWGYLLVGAVYPLLLGVFCFRLFIKKTDLK